MKKNYIEKVGYDKDGWETFIAEWRVVLNSPTIVDFNKQWAEFCKKYEKGVTHGMVEYIQKEWIYPGKQERIFKAWTNQHRHYGTLVTSR